VAFSGVYDGSVGFRGGLVGYVTNLAEARAAAGVPGDAEVDETVRALVRRKGPDGIGFLRGAFAVAIWDESTSRGVLATDHLGAGGLFYRVEGRRLVFATEVRDLLDLLSVTPPPDADSLIRWLAYDSAASGKTLFEGVQRLRPGELIELGRESYRARTYWQPRFREPLRLPDYVDAVRDAAKAAVERRVDRRRTTGVLLSGGLDSSSIVAFAAPRPLHGFSAVFPTYPEMDESGLIRQVADTFDVRLTQLEVRGGSMLAGSLEYLAAWRLPSVSPNLLFLVPLAQAAADEGVGVLLDGEGGDELFAGSSYVFADLVLRGRILAAVRLAGRIPGARAHSRRKVLRWLMREWAFKGALPHSAHSTFRRMRPKHYGAPWLTEAAAVRHGASADPWAWKRLAGPRWWANLAYDFTEGRAQRGGHDFLRHKSAPADVQGRHPYLEDVDLVSQMLAIPSEASYDATFDRPLLRRALAGLVPDSVRLRPEKSYFNALFEEALTSTDRAALLELLGERARISGYVCVNLVRNWIVDPAVRPANWRWLVWRAATAECWLRTLEDSAFPERFAAEWRSTPPRLRLVPAVNARLSA
jgi:asparagine synthase (glutamine-hydrolysing)